MKKYILIQNDGEIEQNSFELIGASTKRNASGKIGFFGSGLKYSIAYMMRNGIHFKIFSGLHELHFTTKTEKLKDQEFNRICINGTQTSYTTTMGPTWTKDWFVLREIYCNALDESSCTIVKETEHVLPSEGRTRIFIELTESLKVIIKDWDKYFSDERTPIFTTAPVYTSGLGSSDNCPDGNRQQVKVYHKTAGIMYRKGINVSENKRFLFDYELSHVDINEDRTAKSTGSFDYGLLDMMGQFVNENWVKTVLKSEKQEEISREYSSICYGSPDQVPSDKWEDFSKENILVVREISGRYAEELASSKKEYFLIPSSFAKKLKQYLPNVQIMGMDNVLGDFFLTQLELNPKMDFLIKEVLKSLKEMNYEVEFEISVAEFDNDTILGQADIKNKKIFIAKQTFDMGRREIAMVIMEENEHIISGKLDETRAFQNHIFSQWLKTMENTNGLFF